MASSPRDLTELFHNARKGMSNGRMITHLPDVLKMSMSAALMFDPKIDNDLKDLPRRTLNHLCKLNPPIIPLAPSASDTVFIISFLFSQISAFQNGFSLTRCLGSSLYVLMVKQLQSPLLSSIIIPIIKSMRTLYDNTIECKQYERKLFTEVSDDEMNEIDWQLEIPDVMSRYMLDISSIYLEHRAILLHNMIISHTTTTNTTTNDQDHADDHSLDEWCNIYTNNTTIINTPLSDILLSSLEQYKIQIHTALDVYEKEQQEFELSFPKGPLEIGFKYDIPSLHTMADSVTSLEYIQSFYSIFNNKTSLYSKQDIKQPSTQDDNNKDNTMNIIEDYVVTLRLLGQVRYIYSFISTINDLQLTAPRLPDPTMPISMHNICVSSLLDAMVSSTTTISLYNTHIIQQPSNINAWLTVSPSSPSLVTTKTLPSNAEILYNNILELYLSPQIPFLNAQPPEPSRSNIRLNNYPFAPYIPYTSIDYSSICNDTDVLSSVRYSPVLGLFPFMTFDSTPNTDLTTIIEYPTCEYALQSMTIFISKLSSLISSLLSVLPTTSINKPTSYILNYTYYTSLHPLISLSSSSEYPSIRLPPPGTPYLSYLSLPERLLFIVESFSRTSPTPILSSILSSIIGHDLDMFGIGRPEALAESYVIAKSPSLVGYIELPIPKLKMMAGDTNYEALIPDEYKNKVNNSSTSTNNNATGKSTQNTAKGKGKNTTNKQIQQSNTSIDLSEYSYGYKLTELDNAQRMTVQTIMNLSSRFQRACISRSRFRRWMMNESSSIQQDAVAAMQLDQNTLWPMISNSGFYRNDLSSFTTHNHNITNWPTYASQISINIELLYQYFMTLLYLDCVSDKEYFIYTSFLSYILSEYANIQAYTRRISVKPGMISTGPRQALHMSKPVQYKAVYKPYLMHAVPSSSSSLSSTYNPVLITGLHSTNYLSSLQIQQYQTTKQKTYPLWTIQPLITSTTTVKRKAKYSKTEIAALYSTFPLKTPEDYVYPEIYYGYIHGKWYDSTGSAPNIPKTASTVQPGQLPSMANDDIPTKYIPPTPQHLMMTIYSYLYTIHQQLMIIASMAGITIPTLNILQTLQYPQPKTTATAASPDDTNNNNVTFKSTTDQRLVEHYISNRFSILHRTVLPAPYTIDKFIESLNSTATLSQKQIMISISSLVKKLKYSCQQYLTMFPTTQYDHYNNIVRDNHNKDYIPLYTPYSLYTSLSDLPHALPLSQQILRHRTKDTSDTTTTDDTTTTTSTTTSQTILPSHLSQSSIIQQYTQHQRIKQHIYIPSIFEVDSIIIKDIHTRGIKEINDMILFILQALNNKVTGSISISFHNNNNNNNNQHSQQQQLSLPPPGSIGIVPFPSFKIHSVPKVKE